MKNCPKCGGENRDDAIMCRECGIKFESPSEKRLICSSCGTENVAGSKFCDKCGKSFNTPNVAVTEKNETQQQKRDSAPNAGKESKNGVAIAVVAVVILALAAILGSGMLSNGSDDDSNGGGSGLIDTVNAKPLDGSFYLSGGVRAEDGTEYWSNAIIEFDNGKLVEKNISTSVKEPNGQWESGIDITRPIVTMHDGTEYVISEPPNPGHVSTMDSIIDHNPFLSRMSHCGDKLVKINDYSTLEAYGFQDSDGNKYYVNKDGRLLAYTFSYENVKITTIYDRKG